jgi:probable F420-dependent oxidoreductase
MKFGAQVRATTDSGDLLEIARQLEAAGFESIFLPEHTHIPQSVQSLFPDDPGWLEACKRFFDPFVALSSVAAVTSSLRLGTGVCLLPQHEPIAFAKTIATLDVISSGRVLLGIGAGWNQPEMRNHGVQPRQRWGVMREHALALRAIWTNELGEFHGQFVDFDPLWSWPKPLQQPHPPLLIGGEGAGVLKRVVEYGDEWLPNDHPEIVARMHELQDLATQAGRSHIPVTAYSVDRDRGRIEELIEAGVDRIVVTLPHRGTVASLRELIAPYL